MASDTPARTVLVTGANIGLGLEACRQLATDLVAKRIILACRSQQRAEQAVEQLRKLPDVQSTFEILLLDVSQPKAAADVAASLDAKLDGLILNAGGMGANAGDLSPDGVTNLMAINLLGHAAFLESLIQSGKLNNGARIVASGSEAARGVPKAVVPFGSKFTITEPYVEHIAKKLDGSGYKSLSSTDGLFTHYADAKAILALYISEMQQKHPQYTFFTITPGATAGTNIPNHPATPSFIRLLFTLAGPMLVCTRIMHPVHAGAERYIAGIALRGDLAEPEAKGKFFGSRPGLRLTGPMCDQAGIMPLFGDRKAQAAAYEAIHRFI